MPKIQNILDDGDQIIDNAESALLTSLDEAEKAIFKEVIKILNEADTMAGKFVSTDKAKRFISSLDSRIMDALYNSKYRLGVSSLLKDYNKIIQNNIEIQQAVNNKNISKKDLSDIQKVEVQNTVDRLLGSGINKDFIAPVRQTLYRSVLLGVGVEETRNALQDYIISTPEKASVLSRYVGQVARDSIMQFDGSIQQAIGVELGLSDYIYTGSLIKDSRDQCVYWVGKGQLNGGELFNEIQTALAKETLTDEKLCSGMNPSCSVATFSIYRGGYNCRHRAIAAGPKSADIEKIKKDAAIKDFPKDKTLTGAAAKLQDRSIKHFIENKDKLVKDYIDEFGNVANTDDARKLFTSVGYNGANASAVHEAASALNKEVIKKLVADSKANIIEMYAGGAGSGKTSAIGLLRPKKTQEVAAIIDGNMASYESSIKKVSSFLTEGKTVNISYVYRDPIDAWENGVIKRMLENEKEAGRVVPLSTFLENTEGSYKTINTFYETGVDKLPNVNINLIDNSLGKGKTAYMDLKKFRALKFDPQLKQVLIDRTKRLLNVGKITQAQYDALIN